mmetsp:Transcript_19626/g.61483  ORF Transcript_19626/g.61483 Transcript_19626/m.61483 type:complete len:81 (+) Transcript_19626:625-867(+)
MAQFRVRSGLVLNADLVAKVFEYDDDATRGARGVHRQGLGARAARPLVCHRVCLRPNNSGGVDTRWIGARNRGLRTLRRP